MPACKDPEKEQERRRKLSEGRTGEKNWMYGKPFDQEHKDNLSKALKGRVITPEWREKLRKAALGRKMSPDARKKMSEAKVGEKNNFFGKGHSEKTKKVIGEIMSKSMIETGRAAGENNPMWGRTGELNPAWKGGISFLPYCYKFNDRRKRAVRKFFGNHCICCGKHVSENILSNGKSRDLDVHHIDHDKEQGCGGKPFNLVPMCITCHSREQHHKEEYREYVNKTLDTGFTWGIWSRDRYELEVMYSEK